MKKRSNVTLALLVVALLAALGMVSAMVKGRPPGPPVEEKEAKMPTGPTTIKENKPGEPTNPADKKSANAPPKENIESERKMREEMMKRMKEEARKRGPQKPADNPLSIDVTPEYWSKNSDGSEGTARIREKADKAEAQMREMAKRGMQSAPTNKPPDAKPIPVQ
jgi:flagellar biosynthesis/type III secretory pathway M-ring protein FliF/YscJ